MDGSLEALRRGLDLADAFAHWATVDRSADDLIVVSVCHLLQRCRISCRGFLHERSVECARGLQRGVRGKGELLQLRGGVIGDWLLLEILDGLGAQEHLDGDLVPLLLRDELADVRMAEREDIPRLGDRDGRGDVQSVVRGGAGGEEECEKQAEQLHGGGQYGTPPCVT
jgi:hypothetical protein